MSERYISRRKKDEVLEQLKDFPVVAILGQRQVGKTALAGEVAAELGVSLLDLQDVENIATIEEGGLLRLINEEQGKLVVLDEIHRLPRLFNELKVIVNDGMAQGKGKARGSCLLVGCAALVDKADDSLLDRMARVYLDSLDVLEVEGDEIDRLWLRGGLPASFLAADNKQSTAQRQAIIESLSERDLPTHGIRIAFGQRLKFLSALAHQHGALLNIGKLAADLKLNRATVERLLKLLVDLRVIRLLPPYAKQGSKRLVKTPRLYYRDSGLLHRLLRIEDYQMLEVHPCIGASWESFVIENILRAVPEPDQAWFYRANSGAEIDLVLAMPGQQLWAIDIQYGHPQIGRGMTSAVAKLQPDRSFVVHGRGGWPQAQGRNGVEFISLPDLCLEIARAAG